jgi:hypothetical protein
VDNPGTGCRRSRQHRAAISEPHRAPPCPTSRTLVKQVSKLVEDPTSTYVIIRGRSTVFSDDGERILAHATDDYSENASIATRLAGTVVNRYVG